MNALMDGRPPSRGPRAPWAIITPPARLLRAECNRCGREGTSVGGQRCFCTPHRGMMRGGFWVERSVRGQFTVPRP